MIIIEKDGSKWLSIDETTCETCKFLKKCLIKNKPVFYNNDFITARMLKFCSVWEKE